MPTVIDRRRVHELVQEGAQLIEGLGPKEDDAEHPPWRDQHPVEGPGPGDYQTTGHMPTRHPVLPRLPVRHERTGRVAAHHARVHGCVCIAIRLERPTGSLPAAARGGGRRTLRAWNHTFRSGVRCRRSRIGSVRVLWGF
jgi:hypothetical protein